MCEMVNISCSPMQTQRKIMNSRQFSGLICPVFIRIKDSAQPIISITKEMLPSLNSETYLATPAAK